MSGILQYLSFCDCLISLNMMSSRFLFEINFVKGVHLRVFCFLVLPIYMLNLTTLCSPYSPAEESSFWTVPRGTVESF